MSDRLRQDSQMSDRLRQDSQMSDTNLSHGHRPDSQLSEAAVANIPLDQVPQAASGLMPPSPAVASPSTPAAASPAALISFSPGTPAVAAPPPAVAAPAPAIPDLHQHPLGPPDLVDHRPNTSQPELVSDLSTSSGAGGGPPDLTSQSHHPPLSSPGLVSHDQHYEFYNQAYSNSQQGNYFLNPSMTKHIFLHSMFRSGYARCNWSAVTAGWSSWWTSSSCCGARAISPAATADHQTRCDWTVSGWSSWWRS